ncbi:MAG: 3-dehydroquinate synthase [Acidobacteriota bacterium]|nr:3-dehydroquinate synthase [Acidobacteriota bacterium]
MSESGGLRVRQWVSMPGGSCDVRMGTGVIDEASPLLKGAAGTPRSSALVVGSDVGEDLVERMRRQLTDAGFSVARMGVPAGDATRTLDAVAALASSFAMGGITSDDLAVVVGDADVLSLASYVCAQWCAGMPLVMVPTDQTAFVEAVLTPRGIDVGARERMLSVRPAAKHVLLDVDVALADESSEDVLMARALMAVTAMCDSEASFSRLWDRSEDLCAGDRRVLCEQLQDTIKVRGKVLSSTALALRQSLTYGESFARALVRLAGGAVAPSTARAEALRFQARLAAGEGLFALDDVLAQDELLDRLELPMATVSLDPDALVAAIREERFARTNRFLLGLPRKLGRVRLAAVSDELLAEHVAAWCASRSA